MDDPFEIAEGADAPAAVRVLEAWVARSDGPRVRRALALALGRTGDAATAVANLREAAFLAPRDPAVRRELGAALVMAGEHREAIAVLQHLVRMEPDDLDAQVALAGAWAAVGEPGRARGLLEAVLALDPADGRGVAERLAALAAAGPLDRHPPAFVRHLFDGFAATYDADMIGRLGYRGPDALLAALDFDPEDAEPVLDVLDLGCGTGLAGAAFRPFARRLEGIDLSPAMAALARRRGVYDDVLVGDLVDHLAATAARWDLLVAADVLNYLGDHGPVFAGARRVLRPGGLFVFSVEAGEGEGYDLGPKRRFRHAEPYVRAAVAAAGLDLPILAAATLRYERGEPVAAFVGVAVSPG